MIYLLLMDNTSNTKSADWSILFSSKSYQKAVACGETGKECAKCGKQTAEEFFVEFQGQGFFPVGPECFKALKKAGITVMTKAEMDAE